MSKPDDPPACPVCGVNDDVEKTPMDDDGSWRWFCFNCGENWEEET